MRFNGADGIRGLACLIVLCAHIPGFFFKEFSLYFSGTGKYGVWLFFVLSAFLLTSKFKGNGFSAHELVGYAVGRCLRIIPLFLIILCIYRFFGIGIKSSSDLFKAATFQSSYIHFWTIPVEFKFYCLLPFVAFALIAAQKHWGQVSTFLLCVVLIAGQQLVWPYWEAPENSISTKWFLPCFILGCYSAVSIEQIRKHVNTRSANFIGIVVLGTLFFITPLARHFIFGLQADLWLLNKFVYLSALWALFLVFLVDGKGLVGAVLRHKLLVQLGAWSYSIYLIHWLVYAKMSIGHQHDLIWAIASLLTTVASGAFFYYLIESPIEGYRHSLQSRIKIKM